MARLCSKFNVLVKTHVCFHQDAFQAPLHCTQVPKLSTNLTLAMPTAIALPAALLVHQRITATLWTKITRHA